MYHVQNVSQSWSGLNLRKPGLTNKHISVFCAYLRVFHPFQTHLDSIRGISCPWSLFNCLIYRYGGLRTKLIKESAGKVTENSGHVISFLFLSHFRNLFYN